MSNFQPYNPDRHTKKSRRCLPHWSQSGATYWVTFRLADSISQSKLRLWREERSIWQRDHPEPWDDETWREDDRRFAKRMEGWSDEGLGACVLRRPEVRAAFLQCLYKFDGVMHDVGEFVVMPNHVYLLTTPKPDVDGLSLLGRLKGASSRACNEVVGRSGPLWLDESFDHLVRSTAQLERFRRYIADNPRKARLHDGDFELGAGQGGAGKA